MQHAVDVLEQVRRAARAARRVGPPHAGLDGRVRQRRRGARRRGDHRRRRRRRPPAGHGGRAHGGAGAGRAGAERRAAGARLAALDRADARRRARGHARDRQGRRDQRGPAGRVDSVELAAGPAREAARVPRRADAEGPAGTAARCRDDRAGRRAGRAGQRPAGAHVHDRRPAHGLPRPHLLARLRHADRAGRRRRGDRVLRRLSMRCARSPRKVAVVTFEFENVPSAATEAHRGAWCRCARRRWRCTSRSSARARRRFLADARHSRPCRSPSPPPPRS